MSEMNLDREELERATAKNVPEERVDESIREVWLALGQLLESARPPGNDEAILARLQQEFRSDRMSISRRSSFSLRRKWWTVPTLAAAALLAVFLLEKPLPENKDQAAPLAWDRDLQHQVTDIDRLIDQSIAFESTTREFASLESEIRTLSDSLIDESFNND